MNRPAAVNAFCLATTILVAGLPAQSKPAGLASQGGVTTRRVAAGPGAGLMSSPSPDGRLLSFIANEGLGVRDLVSGTSRTLDPSTGRSYAWYSAFAPDGRRIAYGWYNDSTKSYELRLIDSDGANPRVLLGRTDKYTYLARPSWSPDGREIALGVWSGNRLQNRFEIALISAETGARRPLTTYASGSAENLAWSPDGRFLAYDFADSLRTKEIHVIAADGTRESLILSGQTRSDLAGWAPAGDRLLFFSDRDGTEGVWSVAVTDGKASGKPVLVRRDLWQSYPIGASRSGVFYAVTTETPSLFVATVDLAHAQVVTAPVVYRSSAVRLIPSDKGQPVWADWSPDGRRLAFANPDGDSPSISIWTLASDEVRRIKVEFRLVCCGIRWAPDGKSLAALSSTTGAMRIDLATGRSQLMVAHDSSGVVRGPELTIDGRFLYYVRWKIEASQRSLMARDLITGRERVVACCGVTAFALAPDGQSVALLNKEMKSTAANPTSIEVMPAVGGASRTVYQAPSAAEALLGSGGVSWSKDGRQLLFVRTGGDVMVVAASGGASRKILGPGAGNGLHLHPDGRRIMYTGGSHKSEIWVMEGLAGAKEGSSKQ